VLVGLEVRSRMTEKKTSALSAPARGFLDGRLGNDHSPRCNLKRVGQSQ